MTAENASDARYEDARRRFEDLEVEEQTRFLIEATASTLAQGLKQAGAALADGIEDVVRQARRRSASGSGRSHSAAAEPETAQRQAPRGGS